MQSAKFGALGGVTLFCAKTQFSLFADGNICLATLHSGGEIAAEVRDFCRQYPAPGMTP